MRVIVGVMIVGAIYLGLLFLAARKLNKGDGKKPEYGSKYSEMLANSNGFPARNASLFEAGGRQGSLSD